jgi:hypothetical protein
MIAACPKPRLGLPYSFVRLPPLIREVSSIRPRQRSYFGFDGVVSLTHQQPLQMLDDPLRRLAVPFRRDRAIFPLPRHQSCQCRRQLAWIGTNEFVRADGDGLGTFGVATQSQARQGFDGRPPPMPVSPPTPLPHEKMAGL